MYETTSLCPECYAEIPAVIYEKENHEAWMTKVCPDHGRFDFMVERDYAWWLYCRTHGNMGIYDGYLVDITTRCNLSCKHCFHGKEGFDRSLDDVMNELDGVRGVSALPIVLFGGEPTIHPVFIDIAKAVKDRFYYIATITNGTMTADEDYFKEILPLFLREDSVSTLIGLSMHPESNGADIKTLENARENGVKLYSCLYQVDDVSQIKDAVAMAEEYFDVFDVFRLRATSKIWAEKDNPEKIYVSDMLKELSNIGNVSIMNDKNKINNFANILFNGQIEMIAASFPDVETVDLGEIVCPPWYMAKDGNIHNLLTSILVNEGIDKGFYRGERLENLNGLV